ncbi:hypothetical protein ACPESV_19190 [Streptomyces umbrinus]
MTEERPETACHVCGHDVGAPWAEPHRRPENRDLLRQIQNIPEEWR